MAASFAEAKYGIPAGDVDAQRIDRDMGSAAGEGFDSVDWALHRGIDRVTRAQFACCRQRLLGDVDGYDPAADGRRDLYCRKAHPATAVHCNPFATAYRRFVDDAVKSGHVSASETGRINE